jgi:hypothetical protein
MLDLHVLPGEYVVCRLPAGSPLPPGLGGSRTDVVCVTWTKDETSVLCPSDRAPEGVETDTQWRCLRAGPVSLVQTGILAAFVAPLAEARVNIFAFSTHDSDYLLVPTVRLSEAIKALTDAGHRVTQ